MNLETIGVRKKRDPIQILRRAMGSCSSQDRIAGFARKEHFLFMETEGKRHFLARGVKDLESGASPPAPPFLWNGREKAFLALDPKF